MLEGNNIFSSEGMTSSLWHGNHTKYSRSLFHKKEIIGQD